MRFVDSHLHLQENDSAVVVPNAEGTDTLLLSCGVDRRTSGFAVRLAKAAPIRVRAFIGVHPSEAEKDPDPEWVGDLLKEATGLGEVGLDPTYPGFETDGAQARAFRSQLEAAERSAKPLQIHSRGAESKVLETIAGFGVKTVLMHWFQSETVLPAVIEAGYFVSFGPAILYSKRLQRMAIRSGPGQVLTETDSPVHYSPLGGVRGPSLVPSVVFKLAELWGESFEEARETIRGSAIRFLGGSEKG